MNAVQSLALAEPHRRVAVPSVRTWSWVLRHRLFPSLRDPRGCRAALVDEHMRCRIRRLKGAYTGRRCFLMGNGPSLNAMDLDRFAGEYVWGTNRCYLLFDRIQWRPAFYMSVDTRVLPDIADEVDAVRRQLPNTVFFFPAHFRDDGVLRASANLYWYEEKPINESRLPFGMFARDVSEWVSAARTVTVACLQLAVYLGFNPIYLIGCDTSYSVPSTVRFEDADRDEIVSTRDDDPNHFDPRYFGTGRKWHEPHVERMLFHYEQAKRACDELHVQVYNATVGGKLEVFPRVRYEDVLNQGTAVPGTS